MNGESEINMTSWEAAINELYQLYTACKKRESQKVSKFIKKKNVKFKLIVGNGTTILHLMCFHGNLGMIKLLIEMYGNTEAEDENQRTPLHLACLQGHFEIVKYLACEKSCNLQCEDKDGLSPLTLAFFQNHMDIVEYLKLESQSSLSSPSSLSSTSQSSLNNTSQSSQSSLNSTAEDISHVISELYLLYKAYKRRDYHFVTESNSRLCGMNVKFVLKGTNSTTILHLMCELGDLDVVKSLTEMYGNVEARNENGKTPLHSACENGHIDVIEYLINQCGCDIEARDQEQFTPLFVACLTGQTDTVRYLVTNFRCKFDVRDDKGRTPLHAASAMGHYEIVQYLITCCGCSPEVRDDELLRTPLHLACLCGHLEIVKYLTYDCKCNTEARDESNSTPLYLACGDGLLHDHSQHIQPSLHLGYNASDGHNVYVEIALYLIMEQGCDPEAKTTLGMSPIVMFYIYGKLSLIKCCIKLKKHNPKTWKSQVNSSQLINLHNVVTNQSDSESYQAQSSAYIAISPLHLACFVGQMDLVKFLVEEYHMDPMEQAMLIGSDDTEESLITEFSDIIKVYRQETLTNMSQEAVISPMTDNISDMLSYVTPLKFACISGYLDILQYLMNKCGPAVSHYYKTLMATACEQGHSDIMMYLMKYHTPNFEDDYGNTMLHYATTGKNLKGAYEIVKKLIASMYNLDQRNFLGETALHTACKLYPCRTDIIELLLFSGCNSQISNFAGKTPLWVAQNSEVFKVFMQYSPAEVCERILSDDIDEEQSIEMLQYLIQQHNWNPNDSMKNGDTALHLACKANRLTIVKHLFSINNFKYDPYAKNKSNQTPIELTSSKEIIRKLIKHGSNPIDFLTNSIMDEDQVLQLVKGTNKDELNDITANDNTALHLACLTDKATIVKYLLRVSKIDVNAKNGSDISPIQLTRNSEIIIELIRYGANPTDLYKYCRRVLGENKILQTTVKVFVLGDSNAGKSTLISSLKKEGWFNIFTSWSSTASTVADNEDSGRGIVTHDFKSKHCGQITLYDFVGKRLFHESQSDLLCETAHSPSVFLVVTNLSSSDEEIISNLQYWLGFLEEISSSNSDFNSHAIVVGSNMDKCREDEKRKASIIKSFLQEGGVNNLSNMDYHDFIALDCRSYSSSGIAKLRRCLAKLCIIARNPKSLAFNAHCFQVYIVDRFREKVAISLHEILNKIREDLEEKDMDENDPLNFLPQSNFQLQNLCVELHSKSQILYLRDSTVSENDFENSWLVIDKAALVSQLFEAFESKVFKKVPSNNGILSFNTISELKPFKVYNPDMFVRFLCHFEYCKEISDQETLQAITISASVELSFERCFFFPALIKNRAPEGIWDGDSGSFSYHCGWILQCTKPEQFFTSKFLQTLILRVMFCNTYLGPSGASIPALLKCSLWKGGIFWGNIFGAESLVEVLPDNKVIVFLMRCRNDNLTKCMEHRSTIIYQIRKCAKEFCGNLKTRESIISPSLVLEYPLRTTLSDLFDIKTMAFAVANVASLKQSYASSLTGKNTIPVRDLLKFEPYIELSALMIQEICNINNPRYISCLTDDFLLHFTQQIRKSSLFIEVIGQILNDHGIVDSNVDELFCKLVEWRDTCHVTYQQLHKCIDQFSIFAGLNIVDMVPGLAVEEFSTPPSSPVVTTITRRKTTASTTDSVDYKMTTDSFNDLHNMQLGDTPKLRDLDLLKLRDGRKVRIIKGIAAKWEALAIRFGFEGMIIDSIRKGAFYQPDDACCKMFIR